MGRSNSTWLKWINLHFSYEQDIDESYDESEQETQGKHSESHKTSATILKSDPIIDMNYG